MTKSKIEDWIEKHTFEIGSFPYEVFDKKELAAFTRLICEEMTGDLKYPTISDARIGYNLRVAEEEQKTREILDTVQSFMG